MDAEDLYEEDQKYLAKAKRGRPNGPDINEHGLTASQEAYCLAYVQHFNKTQAAIEAGYNKGGAKAYCLILHKMPLIKARIDELLASRRATYEVNNTRLQEELSRIAFADPTAIFDATDEGFTRLTVEGLKKLPTKVKACIKSIKATKFGLEVVYHNKVEALDMLAKHLGYYEKDNSQKKAEGVLLYLPDNGRGDIEAPEEEGE